MNELHAVIMAGGAGTRFWPKSRTTTPKQLLALSGERTLLEETVARLAGLCPADRIWIVTGAEQHEATCALMRQLPRAHVIAEPARRDTAACIGLAARLVERASPGARLVLLPADHVIAPAAAFTDALERAVRIAGDDRIATLGIRPTHPATGYGYIERGRVLEPGIFEVVRFVEKPPLERARELVAGGRHYWNGGIFAFSAQHMTREIATHLPDHAARLDRILAAWDTPDHARVFADEFAAMSKISIDYGVMEKTRALAVVEATFDWDDVGSWAALERHLPLVSDTLRAKGRAVAVESSGCVAWSDDPDHLIGLVGLTDVIVVHAGDATLVCHKREAERVKQLVDRCRAQGLDAWLD